MKRRAFISLLGAAAAWPLAASWPRAAHGQHGERMRHVGVLLAWTPGDVQAAPALAALTKGLQELGWVNGRNIRLEYRWTAAEVDRMHASARELVELQPDIIIGHTTPVVAALQRETKTIPIVFIIVSDPVGSGFVSSLPRPGGNMTGLTNFESSLGGKWIELLREIRPRVRRVAIMFNPETAPHADFYVRPIEAAARSQAIERLTVAVRSAADIESAVAGLGAEDGLVVVPDIFTATRINLDLIIALAAQHRVPTIYPYRYMAAVGGLISYGIDNVDLWRRAPSYVDRILKGAKPADLPVQPPARFELVVNLKTARAIGVDIPARLSVIADAVIE
jgi:putative tryptophan/tyrosine transport system substrate-binding protein